MSFAACERLVAEGDPDRHMSARLAGDEAPPLMALYAYNLELARIRAVVSDPMLGEIRLQWWRDALAEIFEGAPPRRHEVVAPLAETIRRRDLPRALFERHIDARGFDFRRQPHPSEAAFDAWLDDAHGGLMRLAALSLGAGAEEERAAGDMGYAAGAASILRGLPRLYAQGEDPLPGDHDRGALREGRTPQSLSLAVNAIAERALRRHAAARAAKVRPRVRPVLLAGWRAGPTLRAAARPGADIFSGLGEESEFARRGRLAWAAMTGRF